MLDEAEGGQVYREGKLVELLNSDFSPKYVFSESSVDLKEKPVDGSKLIFKTYRTNINEKEIRKVALEIFDKHHNNGLFLGSSYLLDKNKPIKVFENLKREKESNLENFKFGNYWGSRFFSEEIKSKIILPTASVVIGFGFENLSAGIISGILGFGTLEYFRRSGKKEIEEELQNINENLGYYHNFRTNLEKAIILPVIPIRAQEIYADALKAKKKLKRQSEEYISSELDVGRINVDLLNAYNTE